MKAAAGPVRFGVHLPQMRVSITELLDQFSLAEDLGFDSAWLMDHLVTPGAPQWDLYEAWTTMAAVAVRTSRISLGHLVNCIAFRHPAVLAKAATTVDHLSSGRLILGLGLGSFIEELPMFGFPPTTARERAELLEETLQVLPLLFSGERVSFDGKHIQLRDALQVPRPVHGRIPILIGGAGPKLTMPLVRGYADEWNCVSTDVERIADLIPLAGSARVTAQHPIAITTDRSERDAMVALATKRYGHFGGLIAGLPDEVIAALQAERDLGVESFLVMLAGPATETMHLLAQEVLPAFA